MDIDKNSYVSVEKDIRRIAHDLLEESKTHKIIMVRFYKDRGSGGEPCLYYRRFKSIPLMQEIGFLEILQPIKKSDYLRNLYPHDLTIVKNPIYEIKVNFGEIAKFLKNPDINLYLEKKISIPIYKPKNYIAQYTKLAIVKKTKNTVCLVYEGINKPSKPISKKVAWYKVFFEFVRDKRLEKKDIIATWNSAGKNKFQSTKKTRHDLSYVPKIRQQILEAIYRASPEIAKHIKIKKGKGYTNNSYTLEVN